MKLCYFTNDDSFPFFIQYGFHDDEMFMHGHEDFSELVIVLEGSAVHLVNEERFDIQKGDVFVMGQGITHGYTSPKNFRICNVMFRPESLLAGDYDIKQYAGFHALFLLEPYFNTTHGFQSRLSLSPDVFIEAEKLIDITINEYAGERPGKETLLLAYFMQLVVLLSRTYDTFKKHKEIDGIASAAALMESSYMDDISIERLLMVSHYSQRHFIRLFSETYHTTPQKYLLGIRIRHAGSLLRDSTMRITEIAISCGFNDPNYFSRVFKKHTGLTPNQYRTSLSHRS